MTDTAANNAQPLLTAAQATSKKFETAFSQFAKCHELYDTSKPLSNDQIIELGESITLNIVHLNCQSLACIMFIIEKAIFEFLKFYRLNFPSATVLPKTHFLEDHIVPWIKKWKAGCGLMGEQGAESLHASFNYTEKAYNNEGLR